MDEDDHVRFLEIPCHFVGDRADLGVCGGGVGGCAGWRWGCGGGGEAAGVVRTTSTGYRSGLVLL